MEKSQVSPCFDSKECNVQIADDGNKVTLQIFQTSLVLYIFELVLYFDPAVINN